jgi:hypothetical protein
VAPIVFNKIFWIEQLFCFKINEAFSNRKKLKEAFKSFCPSCFNLSWQQTQNNENFSPQ